MTRILRRVLPCALSAMLGAGAAQAAPVVVDTEQKAAAAVLSAHHFLLDRNDLDNARQQLIDITSPAREAIKGGLAILSAATTPAALARTSGITLPCLHGGTLGATLSRGLVRTLRLSWNACVQEQFGQPATYQGPGEVVLVGESFAVSSVPALRLGDATQDLTITTHYDFAPYSIITDVRHLNLRMTGLVPMTQQYVGFYFTGAFAYELTGFWEDYELIETADPIYGLPSEHREKLTADHVVTSGYLRLPTTSQTEWLDDETWLLSGRLTTYFDNINGWHNRTESIDIDGLRIRTKELYGGGRQTAVDGRATLNWDPSRGPGCLSGAYTFRTRSPLVEFVGNSGQFQSGELVVNGLATSRYSMPVVPDPSQPWFAQGPVSITLSAVGQFDYLLDWSVQSGLSPIAQCF